jgi:hypothetical protein
MSKTPLQTAIEQVQKMPLPDLGVISILTALLPTEREVIKEAFEEGINPNSMIRNASDYFTTKFNDNEKTD